MARIESYIKKTQTSLKKNVFYPDSFTILEAKNWSRKLNDLYFNGGFNAVSNRVSLPLIAFVNTLPYVVGAIAEYKSVGVSEQLIFLKTILEERREFGDGTVAEKGDFVGELHFLDYEKPDLGNRYANGSRLVDDGLHGLLNLSIMCNQNVDEVRSLKGFYGTSDIVRPYFMKSLGIQISRLSDRDTELSRRLGREISCNNYRNGKDSKSINPYEIYEFWISRNQIEEMEDTIAEIYFERQMRITQES